MILFPEILFASFSNMLPFYVSIVSHLFIITFTSFTDLIIFKVFLAVLGPRCYVRAFSSCDAWRLLLLCNTGFSLQGLFLLWSMGSADSLVVAQGSAA